MGMYRAAYCGFHPLPTLIMVLGFVFFWPIGLAVLAYNMWGSRFRSGFHEMRRQFRNSEFFRDHPHANASFGGSPFATGNTAFDDYRTREMERLEAERRKLDAMRAEFDEFMRNLRRAKDQEEFDRFMNGRNAPRA